ncbi:MAG: hypothetical protein ACRC2T_17820 [Thermoguttaceae bacterium]
MIHDFHKSLARSETIADEAWWEDVYRTAFPYFTSMERVIGDCPEQHNGIDRIIHLQNGGTVMVDEKVRHTDYDDVLIETYSSLERKTLGWACKPLHCDYIAYAFLPSRRCYLFPFQQLQKALQTNWRAWYRGCKRVQAKNNCYTTESLAVPIDVLQKAMTESALIRWDGNTLVAA